MQSCKQYVLVGSGEQAKTDIVSNMGKQGYSGDRLRERIRSERERRGWSQLLVASSLKNVVISTSTISKIEAGDRAVQVDELCAFADLFGVSVDALIGRSDTASDLMWAVSKLTGTAQKCVGEVDSLIRRVGGDLKDVRHYASFDSHSVGQLIHSAETVLEEIQKTKQRLTELAEEFPFG